VFLSVTIHYMERGDGKKLGLSCNMLELWVKWGHNTIVRHYCFCLWGFRLNSWFTNLQPTSEQLPMYTNRNPHRYTSWPS